MTVKLLPAAEADWPAVEAMLQDYLAELSAWSGQQPGSDGRYDYPYLSHYRTDPQRELLLISVDEQLKGFVMCRSERDPASGEQVHELAEFYVVPEARRQGLGEQIVSRVLARQPGAWRVGVFPENVAALAFWRRVLTNQLMCEEVPPVGPRERHIFFNFIIP